MTECSKVVNGGTHGKESLWPNGAAFALFLSHDIDQIYDRELFRVLGDFNHLRRIWTQGEPGNTVHCLRRIAQSIFRPRDPAASIQKILDIERRHCFRSTFFLLEDPVFNRLGGRYRYADPEVKRIARLIVDGGWEIAVHGAYHALNNVEAYRTQLRSFEDAFGVNPVGIRNHNLRHTGEATWWAQKDAGYLYDASFGSNDHVGILEEKVFPFFPFESGCQEENSFVVLPLTIMDSSLFFRQRLSKGEALSRCRELALAIENKTGILTLSWHNNYFEEEEYVYCQEVYESMLQWLSERKPWNATGAEIAEWWRKLHGRGMKISYIT